MFTSGTAELWFKLHVSRGNKLVISRSGFCDYNNKAMEIMLLATS